MMDKWLHKIRLNNCSIWCVSIVLRMWQQDDGVGRVSHSISDFCLSKIVLTRLYCHLPPSQSKTKNKYTTSSL